MSMNPNAAPYHPSPRFNQTPQPHPQYRHSSYPRPQPQLAIVDARPAANTHLAILPNACNTPPRLQGRQMPPGNQVVQPRNVVAPGTRPRVIVFGTVPAAPQPEYGPAPTYHGMYQQAYSVEYSQPPPVGTRAVCGGTVAERGHVAAVDTAALGYGYTAQYLQATDTAYGHGPPHNSSSSVSISSSSQPSSNFSTNAVEKYSPPYISYHGHPLAAPTNPLSPPPFPLPTVYEYNERKDVAKLHQLLCASSRYAVWWNALVDPYHALCGGDRIRYDPQFEPAFLGPGYRDIIVVVALDCSEARGFPSLAPEKGQRLYCFPVSARDKSLCLQLLYVKEALGNQGKDDGTLYIASDANSEVTQISTPGSSQTTLVSPESVLEVKEEEGQREEEAEYKLDVRFVLDGIREGLRAKVTRCEWTTFTLSEKYTLASRMSRRRPEWDGLSGACNLNFLQCALEYEAALPALQKQGNALKYNEACDTIRHAHKMLDRYAFGPDWYYIGKDGNTERYKSGKTLRRPRVSKVGAADEEDRESVRVVDFLPPRKYMFKGLRWMGWKPVAGIEAFFLCLA